MGVRTQPITRDRARDLRKHMTDAETRLWQALRGKQLAGVKFRRQQAIGPYIVDFICLEAKLIVELDGGQHAEAVEYDGRRDAWLASEGFCLLRFWDNEVMENLEGVLMRIAENLSPTPHPSPLKREGAAPPPQPSLLKREGGSFPPPLRGGWV